MKNTFGNLRDLEKVEKIAGVVEQKPSSLEKIRVHPFFGMLRQGCLNVQRYMKILRRGRYHNLKYFISGYH